ncbi:MAG: hypothetical protein SGPRY_010295, partial [Prymnesium sp.]
MSHGEEAGEAEAASAGELRLLVMFHRYLSPRTRASIVHRAFAPLPPEQARFSLESLSNAGTRLRSDFDVVRMRLVSASQRLNA